jgi:hypothetical protein
MWHHLDTQCPTRKLFLKFFDCFPIMINIFLYFSYAIFWWDAENFDFIFIFHILTPSISNLITFLFFIHFKRFKVL